MRSRDQDGLQAGDTLEFLTLSTSYQCLVREGEGEREREVMIKIKRSEIDGPII